MSEAKNILEEENLCENMSFEIFLEKIDENLSEKEYLNYIKYTEKGKKLFINNDFNPEMLYAWDANMDLQIALDSYAVLTYIVSHINNDENGTTAIIKEALSNNVGKEVKDNY